MFPFTAVPGKNKIWTLESYFSLFTTAASLYLSKVNIHRQSINEYIGARENCSTNNCRSTGITELCQAMNIMRSYRLHWSAKCHIQASNTMTVWKVAVAYRTLLCTKYFGIHKPLLLPPHLWVSWVSPCPGIIVHSLLWVWIMPRVTPELRLTLGTHHDVRWHQEDDTAVWGCMTAIIVKEEY